MICAYLFIRSVYLDFSINAEFGNYMTCLFHINCRQAKSTKTETGPLSYTRHKNNFKWIKDLNIRPETIKLLEEDISSKLLDIGLSVDFLNLIPKAKP